MKSRLVLLALIILAVGCNADKEEDSVISGPGYLTSADLVGTWSVCRDATGSGNDFPNPSSYLNYLTFNANGSYSFTQFYYTGTATCQGGSSAFTYTQTGLINPVGLATTPSGATQIELTSDETLITFYNQTIKGHFTTACPTFTLNHTANSARNADTPPCNVGSDVFFDEFTGDVNTTYNVFTLDTTSNPDVLSSGGHFDWQPGMGGYPASTTLNYVKN